MHPRPHLKMHVQLHRIAAPRGACQFMFITGEGFGRANFISADDVPPFTGDHAWYEVEQTGGRHWPTWRAVRRIEPPLF